MQKKKKKKANTKDCLCNECISSPTSAVTALVGEIEPDFASWLAVDLGGMLDDTIRLLL